MSVSTRSTVQRSRASHSVVLCWARVGVAWERSSGRSLVSGSNNCKLATRNGQQNAEYTMWRRINYVLWLTPADVASSSLILCGELAPPNIADSGRARNSGSGRATIRRRVRSCRVPGVEALLEVPIEQAKTSNPKASSQTRSPTGGVGRRELAIRRFVCISRRSRRPSPGVARKPPSPVGDDRSHLRRKAPQLSHRSGQKLSHRVHLSSGLRMAVGMRAGVPWQLDDPGRAGRVFSSRMLRQAHMHVP